MGHLSATDEVLFCFAVLWCLFWAFIATRSRAFLLLMAGLGAVQWALTSNGFYADTTHVPPPQLLLVGPVLVALAVVVLTPAGRRWLHSLGLLPLVMLNVLRIPVELVLHEGYVMGLVPRGMTFSGHNFDILSGISAALMAAWLLSRRPPSRTVLIAWNVVCLVLLAIVVVTAVGSIPSAVQRWNFDRPNVLVLTTPYVLLPAILVPAVLWSHLAMLVKLAKPGGEA